MTDVLKSSATEAAAMIRRKEISSRELTEALFAHIDEVNPAINAVVAFRRDEAMTAAAAADDVLARGDVVGPLHGVPMTIKESFDVAGLHTTWGNPEFAEPVAQQDSTVVARLRRAGAIIIGKSNVAFMLSDIQTANPLFGVTNNPADRTRTPGGSSGGAAAALASGVTFLEYGTDLSGSIRNPASFCGVYGLRPTAETVPPTGMAPPGPPGVPVAMTGLTAVGPLARSAADLRLALQVTAGPEGSEAKALSWRLPAPRHRNLADFRIRFVLDDPTAPVSSEVVDALSSTIDAITAAGATVVEGWPDGMDPAAQFRDFGFHLDAFFALQGDGALSHKAFIEADNRRLATRAAWARCFDDVDVFLCPTNSTPAFPHDERPFDERTFDTSHGPRPYHEQFFWTAHASLSGLPAASAPIGTTPSGLPVGMQIIGPHFEDDTVLTFAETVREFHPSGGETRARG